MKIPELETARLRLRAFRDSDLDAFAAMSADEEVMRYIGTGVALKRPEAWRSMAFFLGHWELRGHGMWALESKATGELIGRAGFLEPDGWPGFELGWLLSRSHWGQGYAKEAAKAALAYAFGTLKRDRVISLIRPDNARSIKLAVSLGYTRAADIELLGGKALVYEIHAP
jgi:RimJ/RimL family protein N-acetyltransferase